ncbi:MAG: T9SS type A sorting domain-containing protein, partial [Candidatus Hatepunaea meridiana]|nr:T9SS type A sorting domain-containing protein [Candidatus Hatepunaea meridiana]
YTLLSGKDVYNQDALSVIKLTESVDMPDEFAIVSAYPNPFNSSTLISYGLPEAVKINLNVYDLSGRKVMNLTNGLQQAGNHTIQFNGTNLASGVYLLRLETTDHLTKKKIVLVK